MKDIPIERTFLKLALVLVLVFVTTCLTSAWAATDGPGRDRLTRKVRVMERVLDEILVQSPHVRVSGGSNTRGLVLDEFGALFTLEASLGVERFGYFTMDEARVRAEEARLKFEQARVEAEEARMNAMEHEKNSAEEEASEERAEARSARAEARQKARIASDGLVWSSWPDSMKDMKEEGEKKKKEHLEGFKTELIDTLIDYGPTLGELKDNQWVAVVAFLDDQVRLIGQGSSGERLILKVKMADLRQYAAGKTSRSAITSRVSMEQQ
jgi:hypothetical protein